MKKVQFVQIPYSWYNLIRPCSLSVEDVNLLGIINSLQVSTYGCIASDEYFEKLLQIHNVGINLKRLSEADLISINNGKVRRITINKEKINSVWQNTFEYDIIYYKEK